MYTIRKVRTEAEKLKIAYLNEMIFPVDYPVKLLREGAVYWLCREEATGDVVGFTVLFKGEQKGHWILERSGVLEAHRGNGLQGRFIKVRVREVQKAGGTALTSWTYNNSRSANNLINEGFRMFDPKDPWGADGAVYFKKRLTKKEPK